MTCREECEAKLHLRATKTREFCLGASSNQRLTSKEYKRGAFSPCRLEANQVSFFSLNLVAMNKVLHRVEQKEKD